MEEDYGKDSDEVKIRVDGEFAGEAEMNDKGWIPLFANVSVMFEPIGFQVINRGLISCDPAGQGKDKSIAGIRDNIYLKEVLNESTSNEIDLARKIETIRDVYNCSTSDIAVDAFGIGAKVVVNIRPRENELNATPVALLVDKAREETKHLFKNYNAELAWKFREWVRKGGIIITNDQKGWLNELSKIMYRRDGLGRIELMPKVEFKKENGFSPDRFDMAKMTFFKDEAYMPVQLTKQQLEQKETAEFLQKIQQQNQSASEESYSSM
jgi:hypothetical protein